MTGTQNKIRGLLLAALMVTSVFAGAIAFSGAAAAQSRTTAFQGQVVTIQDSSLSQDETVTIVDSDDGTVADQVTADAGNVTIETEGLDPGLYELENENGSVFAELRVSQQTLDASFADDNVETGDSTTLTLDSNRASYTVNVSADGLDNSQIVDIFNASNASEVDGNVQIDVSSDQLNADFTGVNNGDYQFDFEVADTTASATASIGVGDVPDTDAQFSQSVYEGTQGDVTEIDVEMTETSEAQVQVGSDAVNYNVTLNVTDGNDDGEVTILFNTHATASENVSAFSAADDADAVSVSGNETTLNNILEATDYDLSASVGGDETDVATLVINEGSVDSLNVETMPGASFGDAGNASEVEEMTTDRSEIAQGDAVALRLEGSGIFGAIESNGGFDAMLTNTGATLEIEEVESGPNEDADSLNTSQVLDASNVYADADSGVVYVVVDSGQLPGDFQDAESYDVTLTLTEDTGVSSETTLNTSYNIVERTVEFDTEQMDGEDKVVVRAESNATISGETSVAPGTEGTVRVKSTGDSPFLLDDDVEVQDNGTFEAEFDMEGVNPNTTFTATVELDQGTTAQAEGVVEPAEEASVNIQSQNVSAGDNQTIVVSAVRFSDGGFVTIHDSSLLDGDVFGSVRGTSDYIDSQNADEVVRNVEIQLDEPYTQDEDGTAIAMPHKDTNDNQEYDFVDSNGSEDGPYTEDGEPVTDQATVTVSDETQGDASVTIDDQTTDGSVVTVASASLPEGGFITIHDDTLLDGATLESVRGTSDYQESGNVSDVDVTLDEPYSEDGTVIAMPHQDTNDNQQYDFVDSDGSEDGPYTNEEGNIVTDDAQLTVGEDGNQTTEGEGTEGTEGTAQDGEETTEEDVTPGDETETTEGDGPGFGAIVALIALVAAALLAVRRGN